MSALDSTIWIVHRNAGARSALGRIAASASGRHEVILGGPDDPIFESAPAASIVALGLAAIASGGDMEEELEFARWASERLRGCAWILIAEPADHVAIRELFDTLDPELLAHPCDAPTFKRALRQAVAVNAVEPLSLRSARDHTAARFARWFGRNEPAELVRALSTRHAGHPLLAVGEAGTGRSLLVRYAHAFSAGRPGPLVRIACQGATRPAHLLEQLDDGVAEALRAPALSRASHRVRQGRWGIWLEAVDELPITLQRSVLAWIELGLAGDLAGARLRWFASAGPGAAGRGDEPPGLEPGLARALGELLLETTPLRMQRHVIVPFVEDTARAWSAVRRDVEHRFDPEALEALRAEPWPGNMAELEAVVMRTLAHLDPETERVSRADLRFEVRRHPPVWPAEPGYTPAEPLQDQSPLPAPSSPPSTAAASPAPAPATADESASREGHAQGVGPLQRLARAVAHEIRNPLVPIRTLSELLPEHYADEEFRTRFASLVETSIRRIEVVVDQLQRIAEAEPPSPEPEIVDVTQMIEQLLDAERARINARRLLALKELDRGKPNALCDREPLRQVLAGLIRAALDAIPDQGDLYVASRHSPHAEGAGGSTLRVLLRYPNAPPSLQAPGQPEASQTLRETSLAHVVADAILRSRGGSLAVDDTDAAETVVVIDLPAPD